MNRPASVLIVGAGLSGLSAADILTQEGIKVCVLEKSRGVGGRMATRRIGDAIFDHGAQFMTVRDNAFAQAIAGWSQAGSVKEWFSSTGTGGTHTRYRGNPSMTAIARTLSQSMDVQLSTRVVSLSPDPSPHLSPHNKAGWRAVKESGETIVADAVILTSPVPQSLALLDAGLTALPRNIRQELEDIFYESCIAVMAVLEEKSRLPEQGWLVPTEGPIAWIADNQSKGISPVPAVTIHAKAGFSETHWEDDRQKTGEYLLSAARQWLGCGVRDFQVHGWRYSKPVGVRTQQCLGIGPQPGSDGGSLPPLVFAGDAFGRSRVEGAFLSGRAAAAYLIARL
ncbi:NAD(P)/FAD-dependent oxidoreductase [Spirochaeta dissipatitropha]